MEGGAEGISRSRREAARLLVQKAVQARRRQDGFPGQVPSETWAEGPVRQRLEAASRYLAEECCEGDWNDLKQNPYPDDDDLDERLQAVGRALNSQMVYAGREPSHADDPARPARRKKPEQEPVAAEMTEMQQVHSAAATDYVHWLLEADNWVQAYRANLPGLLTEKEMVDFLSSPLSQVLSFADFRELGLCPVRTRGRCTLIKQWTCPKPNVTMADRDLARRGSHSLEILVSEFAVEVDRPDGATIHLTIERRGDAVRYPVYFRYESWVFDLFDFGEEEQWRKTECWRTGRLNCHMVADLWDRKAYPTFPRFHFIGYRGSICHETYGLIELVRDDGFSGYKKTDAALRFLLMGIHAPLFDVEYHEERIDVSQWQWGSLGGVSRLAVPPWILPEELADYWRQVRPKKARHRRLPSVINTALFRFVLENTMPGKEPQWASLARDWNELSGERITRDKLYKVYHSVRDALFPDHPAKVPMVSTPAVDASAEEWEEDWNNNFS